MSKWRSHHTCFHYSEELNFPEGELHVAIQ